MELRFDVREDGMWLEPLTLNNGTILEVKSMGIGDPEGYRIFLLANNKVVEETSTNDKAFIEQFGPNESGTREGTFEQINKWVNYLYEKYEL